MYLYVVIEVSDRGIACDILIRVQQLPKHFDAQVSSEKKKKNKIKQTRKAPGALDPAVVPPPPGRCVKYVTVTQDKSPWLCSERHDEYFFSRAKTGGLGQVTTKKKNKKKTKKKTPRKKLLDPVLTAG